jgi:hypothetical protein
MALHRHVKFIIIFNQAIFMLYFIGNEFLTRTKGIILITLLLLSTCWSKELLLSADGNNSNDGLSPTTAWQTIGKVNGFVFTANDYILFRRGDTFYGGLVIKQDNLSIGAYGSGAAPVISGLSTVTGGFNLGGNIWRPRRKMQKPVSMWCCGTISFNKWEDTRTQMPKMVATSPILWPPKPPSQVLPSLHPLTGPRRSSDQAKPLVDH